MISSRLIYIVETPGELRSDLAEQIGHYGFGVREFNTLADARDSLKESNSGQVPAAMILEMPDTEGDGVMQLADIQMTAGKSVPIILLSDKDDMRTRLDAVRFGGKAFFHRSTDPDILIGKLEELLPDSKPETPHIMIVEGDPTLAGELQALLGDVGMVSRVVLSPALVMESLVESHADLILMNLYFPDVLGMELAGILRQQKVFQSIPILFYSSDNRMDRQMAAMRKGGDGYLPLPIDPEHLVSSVTYRVGRARIIRSLIVTDSLTGLINFSRLSEMLKRELNRAIRENKELAFALFDLDGFKKVNDTYGHHAGDRVLKSLSRLLKQRLSSVDLVGRFGGATFGAIIRSMDAVTAARVINEIRLDFSMVRHNSDKGKFFASFSCGISMIPPRYSRQTDNRLMVEKAERALDEAARRGKNKVVLMQSGGAAKV